MNLLNRMGFDYLKSSFRFKSHHSVEECESKLNAALVDPWRQDDYPNLRTKLFTFGPMWGNAANGHLFIGTNPTNLKGPLGEPVATNMSMYARRGVPLFEALLYPTDGGTIIDGGFKSAGFLPLFILWPIPLMLFAALIVMTHYGHQSTQYKWAEYRFIAISLVIAFISISAVVIGENRRRQKIINFLQGTLALKWLD